jgi:hypothetical protein
MTTIYKVKNTICDGEESNLISSVEAKEYGINTKNAKLASIEDCKTEVKINNDLANAFIGKIKVKEGIFKFDFDKKEYIKIK